MMRTQIPNTGPSLPTGSPWRYDGRRVVVTGCASGIGAATVAELQLLGATVIGLDINEPADRSYEFIATDMGRRDSIDAAVERIGVVEALCNCAGITGTSPIEAVMRVNFLGLRLLTEQLTEAMSAGGAVASVASVGGAHWTTNLAGINDFLAAPAWSEALVWCAEHPEFFPRGAYSFSKQCIIADSLKRSVPLGARGIRINTISPGITETPMIRDSGAVGGASYMDTFPRPLGRNARADEQARALAFLNSDAASYISGVNLWTDGGMLGGVAVGAIADPIA